MFVKKTDACDGARVCVVCLPPDKRKAEADRIRLKSEKEHTLAHCASQSRGRGVGGVGE